MNIEAWARQEIASAATAQSVDAVLVAFVSSRYHAEARSEVAAIVSDIAANGEFTRDRTITLAAALERRWIEPSSEVCQRFVEYCHRLEGQAGHPENDPTTTPRVMWLCSRGALVPEVVTIDPGIVQRMRRLLEAMRNDGTSLEERVVAAAALGDLVPEHRDDIFASAMRDVETCLERGLSTTGAIAGAWLCGPVADAWTVNDENATKVARVRAQLRGRALEHAGGGDIAVALMAASLFREHDGGSIPFSDARSVILAACDTFSEVARRMRDRKHQRPPLLIENEYDVQDLLYAMLKTVLPDLVDEDPTTKRAGTSTRIDFTTASGRAALEAKFVRDGGHAKKVPDEIRIDIDQYPDHADCAALFFFVWDPDRHIADAGATERDLSGVRQVRGRDVAVVVRVRPR